jgi:hypothetical protein
MQCGRPSLASLKLHHCAVPTWPVPQARRIQSEHPVHGSRRVALAVKRQPKVISVSTPIVCAALVRARQRPLSAHPPAGLIRTPTSNLNPHTRQQPRTAPMPKSLVPGQQVGPCPPFPWLWARTSPQEKEYTNSGDSKAREVAGLSTPSPISSSQCCNTFHRLPSARGVVPCFRFRSSTELNNKNN